MELTEKDRQDVGFALAIAEVQLAIAGDMTQDLLLIAVSAGDYKALASGLINYYELCTGIIPNIIKLKKMLHNNTDQDEKLLELAKLNMERIKNRSTDKELNDLLKGTGVKLDGK